ncbi:hypothetical protein [Pseudomonas kuykendallii]|uniref:hypothetical protein n=1 Tax=Pseudomonas kuykendallii TaxID=1007099 RepID=UPI0028D6399A|nr:hypothetical protein [Pseudomonas kuykendallii]
MNEHLREWLANASPERRDEVARKAGTSAGYLWQLAGGHRKPTPEIAERLQESSGGEITIAGLRPDLVSLAKKILHGTA